MAETTYRCVIADGGFTDYTLPISSFQMRLRHSPKQCYLSVIVPSVLAHAQAIADRIDGTLTLTMIVAGVETELLEANVSAFRQYLGARDRSGEITAYKQITFSSPVSITIESASYKGVDGATTRYRFQPIPVNPGDTLAVAGDSFVPTEVAWSVSGSRAVVEANDG